MNSYVNNHLHERKLSVVNMSKSRTTRESIKPQKCEKYSGPFAVSKQSPSNIYSPQFGIPQSVEHARKQIKYRKDGNIQKNFSGTKDSSMAKEQDNSDYIRNLYKKYLGKENKEPLQKLNAYTQRKLKTAESKEILVSNTVSKNITRRALFTESQSEFVTPVQVKNQKTKITALIHNEEFKKLEKKTIHERNISHQLSLKDESIKPRTKKEEVRKSEHEIQNRKSSAKNYKSKSKADKNTNQVESKHPSLKRSQSTQLKSQKYDFPHSNMKFRQKLITESSTLQAVNDPSYRFSGTDSKVHPHRQSYCQFDTEQQTETKTSHAKVKAESKTEQLEIMHKKNHSEGIKMKCLDMFKLAPNQTIISTSQEDVSMFDLILGKQNSFVQALKRINKVKSSFKDKESLNPKTNFTKRQSNCPRDFY